MNLTMPYNENIDPENCIVPIFLEDNDNLMKKSVISSIATQQSNKLSIR